MDFKTPIAKAQGLGSAKTGTMHWWLQRVTAVALLPLSYWLLAFLSLCVSASYQQTLTWLQMPWHSACLAAWVLAAFYHAALGVQVVIEDYVPGEARKILSVWLANLVFGLLALTALLALLRIVVKG